MARGVDAAACRPSISLRVPAMQGKSGVMAQIYGTAVGFVRVHDESSFRIVNQRCRPGHFTA